jgi:hypothetical protein
VSAALVCLGSQQTNRAQATAFKITKDALESNEKFVTVKQELFQKFVIVLLSAQRWQK